MEIFVTSRSFGKYNKKALSYLKENGFSIRWISVNNPSDKDIATQIGDAEVLVVGNNPVTKHVFQNAPNLKLVFMNGTGTDAIDIQEATKHGVYVCNCPGANKNAVAEYTVMLMLMAGRRPDKYQKRLRTGYWGGKAGRELSNSTVGLVGLGNIGKRIVELLKGFRVQVIAYDPFADSKWAEINNVNIKKNEDEVFKLADFLVLTAPLNDQTEMIINEKSLSLMKKSAFLINTARGALVDEKVLYKAIKEKWISGAALDTFVEEPPHQNSPLFDLDIIMTPHLAASSIETSARLSDQVARGIVDIIILNKPYFALNYSEIYKEKKND